MTSVPTANIQRLAEQAVALHQRGREAEAEQLYRQILSAAPGNFTACYMLGVIRSRQGRNEEALELLGRAAAFNPAATGPLIMQSLVLQAMNRLPDALARLDRALSLDPRLVEALVNRGNVLCDMGRFAEALASHERALALKPDFLPAHYNRAIALSALGRFREALASLDQVLAAAPRDLAALNNRGSVLRDLKRFEEALASFDQVLAINPGNAQALYNRGTTLRDLDRLSEALAAFDRALQQMPNFVAAMNNRAAVLHGLKRPAEALAEFDRALRLEPGSWSMLNNRGNILREMKRPDEALASIEQALALKPDFVEALDNRGTVLRDLKRLGEALESFDRALAIEPGNWTARSNRGLVLLDMDRAEEALEHFEQVLAADPANVAALYNRGLALRKLGRFADAMESYDRVISIAPGFADAWLNRGELFSELASPAQALESYERALAINPRSAPGLNGRGVALQGLRRFPEALASYSQAMDCDPGFLDALYNRGHLQGMELRQFEAGLRDLEAVARTGAHYDYLPGDIVHLKMHRAQWSGIESDFARLDTGVRAGERVVRPFVYQAISQSPADLMAASRIYAADRYPPAASAAIAHNDHAKIRVGYVSADFRAQATAFLAAGLYEKHDKSSFEIFAFDAGWNDESPMRRRLESAFDKFVNIATLTDEAAAARIAEEQIDILVNLNGYFGTERMGVFARRPAPIQVNYLGFPATLGAAYIDYILADRIVIPEADRNFYAEQVVYLPDSYQVNDDHRPIAAETPTRAACGLPEEAFVFCNFNNSYKLTPAIFAVWMAILKDVQGSVLWLLESNSEFPSALRQEAVRHGVAAERLVFAPTTLPERHLARLRLADLFLDGLPYNAHTTASDSLWARVPLLTCLGKAFPGRVAASLLHACGLAELICENLDEYCTRAVRLAQNRAECKALRDRLALGRGSLALFDTARSTRHLESAYRTMSEMKRRGEAPRSFAVLV
jgi:predicted O-linked N-acetylglucosamine transferase (SPINDLY family)